MPRVAEGTPLHTIRRGKRANVIVSLLRSNALDRIEADLTAIGLDSYASRLGDSLEMVRSLRADTRAGVVALDQIRADLVADVAQGKRTAGEAAEAYESARRASIAAPVAHEIAGEARSKILRDTCEWLIDHATEIADALDAVVQDSAKSIIKAAPQAEEIRDDSAAGVATGAQHKAWVTLTEARQRIEAAWRIASRLRDYELFADFRPALYGNISWRYRNPEVLELAEPRSKHPNWIMAARIEAGAKPAVIKAEEIEAQVR